MTSKEMLSAEELDRLVDEGEVDMTQFMKPGTLKMPNVKKSDCDQRKMTITVPEWVLASAERQARHIGTTRGAVVNTWMAYMAEKSNRGELVAM